MIRAIIMLLLISSCLWAGLFDFWYISRAKSSYSSKNYEKSINLYDKVEKKQGARYNLANSLYKAKEYKKALKEYKKIIDKNLEFKILYNMGNTYAKLKQYNQAISSYKKALKLKEDSDTRFNLALLKKKQRLKELNRNKSRSKNRSKKKQAIDKKTDKKNNMSDNRSKNREESQQDYAKSSNSMGKRENQSQVRDKILNEEHKLKLKKKQKITNSIGAKEERTYNKMLNLKEVRTLMLPLNNTNKEDNEKNIW